jgi:hypothetical protein
MNNILLISYLCGSSGAFLEHFLMKHAGIFNKGYAQITMYNEYDNMYRKDQALLSLTKIETDNKFNDGRDPLRNPQFMPDETKANETDTIIIAHHELEGKYNFENKNLSILGIDVEDTRSREYAHVMELLKQCSGTYEDISKDKCVEYENGIKCQNVPYYFINHHKFFLEVDINEYKNMCQFLNIEPKIEMYLENINHYMYENNRLLNEYKLL